MRKCRRKECWNDAAPGQGYCSRACAPYGYLGDTDAKSGARKYHADRAERSRLPGELSTRELADATGISQPYLFTMFNENKIPGRQAENRLIYFRPEDVRKALIKRGWIFGANGKAIKTAQQRPIGPRWEESA